MKSLKRKLATIALAAIASLGVVFAAATPAQAVTWYQTTGSDARCGWTASCWVEYTGSWPNNQVRAAADANLYSIRLMVSTNGGPPGRQRPLSTAATQAGRRRPR